MFHLQNLNVMSKYYHQHSIRLLNYYEVYISNHNESIRVAASNIYDACSKVSKLISTWETSDSHEIVSVHLVPGSILC